MFYSSLKPDEGDEDENPSRVRENPSRVRENPSRVRENMSRVREALCNKRHQLLSTIVSCNDRYLFPKKLMR